MLRIKKQIYLLITILLVLSSYMFFYKQTVKEIQGKTQFTLTIMHVNDTHGHVEQYPKLYAAVKEVRAKMPNTLLFDAGDVFCGTLYFTQYSGLADVWFMDSIGYDATTFGNHEFVKDSTSIANFIKKMTFPLVSANVNVANDPILESLAKKEISENLQENGVYPAIIKNINGEKVGIFGLTTEETPYIAAPSKEVVFGNAVEKAKEMVSALKHKGVNKIIVLSHLGYVHDLKLAKAVDGIDVIIGGHSHTKLEHPIVIKKSEPTVIVQAHRYLDFLGETNVTFNNQGVVTAENGKLINLESYKKKQDPKLLAKVAQFKAPLEKLKKQTVGMTEVDLNGSHFALRTKETNLGDLITDAMAQKANATLGNNTTIAMETAGSIRGSIKKGNVTLGEICTILPSSNLLVTLDLTGQEIWAALEHGVSQINSPISVGQFMQVSGLQYKFDPAAPPYKRVWEVNVKTPNGYEPIDSQKTYSVAMNAYVADGSHGYSIFRKAKDEGRMHELYVADYEILADYISKNSPVSPLVERRIIKAANPGVK